MQPVPEGPAEEWADTAFASLRQLFVCNMELTWPMVCWTVALHWSVALLLLVMVVYDLRASMDIIAGYPNVGRFATELRGQLTPASL